MALPININDLINGTTVEWERIEFREGWNPERTIRTICAFANDFNNWGGGYVIIGIAEEDNIPKLPPVGLKLNQIDKIQKELVGLCRKILPSYSPISEPVDFMGKKILILWCPGGSNRPYKAPDLLKEKATNFYYIRKFSSTVKPSTEEELELLSMSNKVPFDDQVNHRGKMEDFDLSSIRTFLNEIKSDLEHQIHNLQMNEIARKMNIVEGADEILLPKNAGILFFAKDVQKFFPYVKIEIATFYDESGTNFTEKIFTGQIHVQLQKALTYLKDSVVREHVKKIEGKAESKRFFNFPYEALEEALCNAVYHRGYDNDSTIEIRNYPNRLSILSFPGPLPPLDKLKLQNLQFDVRKYRNRRIGEFLKELHLTEGRATGIPTILDSLKKNGSPEPLFETDDDRSYFKVTFPIHPDFPVNENVRVEVKGHEIKVFIDDKITLSDQVDDRVSDQVGTKSALSRHQAGEQSNAQVSVQVSAQVNLFNIINLDEILALMDSVGEQESVQVSAQVSVQVKKLVHFQKIINLNNLLAFCLKPQTRKDILHEINLTNHPKNYKTNIGILINDGILKMTVPDKPNSPNQKYVITEKGKKLLKIIEKIAEE